MPKTLSQAEKNLVREQRMQEKALQRLEAKKFHDLALQKKAEEEREATAAIPGAKKTLKALKKEKKVAEKLEKERLKVQEEEKSAVATQELLVEGEPYLQPSPAPTIPPLPSSSYTGILSEIMTPRSSSPSSFSRKGLEMAIIMAAAEAERETVGADEEPARLVENHSTYCEGLRPILVRLEKVLPGCTIIPGKISGGKSQYETFAFHFQRAIDSNTYKFVARNGMTAQDVTISVPDAERFTEAVVCEQVENVLSATYDRRTFVEEEEDLPLSHYNHRLAIERGSAWKVKHHEKHQKIKEKEEEIKEKEQVKTFSRTLRTKGLPLGEVEACAVRDRKIVSGENRGKHSMR